MVLQEYVGYVMMDYDHPFNWGRVFVRSLISDFVILLFAPAIEYVARLLTGQQSGASLIVRCIVISIVVAALHRVLSTVLFGAIIYLTDKEEYVSDAYARWLLANMLAGIVSSIILFWMGVGAFMAAINHRKLISKERELTHAKVHALMTQLRPHFLFNTLNSISALIDINTADAQKVISRFADLLRFVLNKETTQYTTLSEEIRFAKNYLNIEKERYRDRLTLSYHLATDTLQERVPTLILQPLVENAIKHGIARKMHDGHIAVTTKYVYWNNSEEVRLSLEVWDNGQGCQLNYEPGVGLTNITSRLAELYGDQFSFTLDNHEEGGCVAKIVIPLTNPERRRTTA